MDFITKGLLIASFPKSGLSHKNTGNLGKRSGDTHFLLHENVERVLTLQICSDSLEKESLSRVSKSETLSGYCTDFEGTFILRVTISRKVSRTGKKFPCKSLTDSHRPHELGLFAPLEN